MTHTKIVQRKKNHLPENLKNLHPILQQVYANRGVTNMDDLEKGLSGLLPYNGMLNIDKAITLLYQVMIENKKILIVGDFDADGATSTAVAVSALKSFGVKNVEFLVPNRFEYGYGLTPEIVKVAVKLKPDLLITVDNGISSIAGVEEAHRHNIKVLITDHHLPGQAIPDAEVIINPNQKGCAFSSKCIAGVGVIFYVMLALRSYLREKNWFLEKAVAEPNMADLLDLVALGTIADVVSLDRNNRILVHQGLMRIRQGNCRPGIKALLTIANREQKRLAASDLAFAIAPRLNAAGRLDDMTLGIQCLLSNDFANALDIAKILDELNQERRYIEADMQHQAMQELNKLHLENKKLPAGLCLFDENWHQGVIGILAGRIKDRYHRPVIVFALGNDTEIKGSARSIEGIHIRDILDGIATKYPDLISKFGGHAMAAGLTIKKEHFSQFSEAFNQEILLHIDENIFQSILHSDGELEKEHFTLDLAQVLKDGGPWGHHFAEPLFDGTFELLEQRLVGQKHLKMTVRQNDLLLDAIAFNVDLEKWPNHRCSMVNLAYRLDINEFRGIRTLQLLVEHLEPCA